MIVPAADALITNGSLKRYSGVAAGAADDDVRDAKVEALRGCAPDGAQTVANRQRGRPAGSAYNLPSPEATSPDWARTRLRGSGCAQRTAAARTATLQRAI